MIPSADPKSTFYELRKFVAPEFIFGIGARRLAGRYARNLGAHKVLVVSDPGVITAGWVQEVIASLEAEQLAYTIFSDIHSNPRASEVMLGAQCYQDEKCNLILAVGGGSPMDCAKGIGIVSANQRDILSFEGVDEVPNPGPPLICVPTTAGSSADVSQFAIINDTGRRTKIAIISKTVVPDVALIDPETTTTMDAYLTACTGLDALTHAFEAYVSNASSPISDLHALQAIRLSWQYLPLAYAAPQNLEYRSQMMLASLHAGLAFSNASLGAVHAMAHSLGGLLDLPHGECNALLLELVVGANFASARPQYEQIADAMGLNLRDLPVEQASQVLTAALRGMRSQLGIRQSFGAAGIDAETIHALAQKASEDPCLVTNPRGLKRDELEGLYEQLR